MNEPLFGDTPTRPEHGACRDLVPIHLTVFGAAQPQGRR